MRRIGGKALPWLTTMGAAADNREEWRFATPIDRQPIIEDQLLWHPGDSEAPPETRSLDGLITLAYSLASDFRSEPDKLDRLRALYAPIAQTVLVQRDENDRPHPLVISVDDYLASLQDRFPDGAIYEEETGRVTQQYGSVASVISAFTASHEPNGEPFIRGVNHVQLFHDGVRWWIVSLTADFEHESRRIPAELLAADARRSEDRRP